MKRRGRTVLVGAVLVAGLTALAMMSPVPYVRLAPGPTYDTLGVDDQKKRVITVSGAESASAGQLRFVTISVHDRPTLLQALIGWWSDDDAVVPRELIYPPDQTPEQVEEQNKSDFTTSESAAQVAALAHLGQVRVEVKSVTAGQPADGVLKPGDVITSIDGKPVNTSATLLDAIRAKPAGSAVALGVTRAGKPQQVRLTPRAGTDGVPRIGVEIRLVPDGRNKVDFSIDGIGGPSAGLMLALGIVDKIDPADLTGGKIIAGTGTIDENGAVGPIGGVPQKLVAARRDGATFFLTPKENCAEAMANPVPGLTLVEVTSLDGALTALSDIRAGRTPPQCHAGG